MRGQRRHRRLGHGELGRRGGVELGQDHHVGALDLDLGGGRGRPRRRPRQRIDDGHDRRDPDPGVERRPLEGPDDRHRLGHAGGLEQERVDLGVAVEDLEDRAIEIVGQHAADAAARQLDLARGAARQQIGVDADRAQLVDDDRQLAGAAARGRARGDHPVDQRGLAGAEEAREHYQRDAHGSRGHCTTPRCVAPSSTSVPTPCCCSSSSPAPPAA
ncbi:MAG: hypothetical protein IPL61_12710 [Myxococcales bacterium]|nr:hypothetical protein [Myxococcales bacterium]